MLALIYRFSRGIPRLINILCDFALLSACVEGKNEVTSDTMREVVNDLEARDYWSDSQDTAVLDNAGKDNISDFQSIAGDIALRLIKLEETVNKNIKEMTLLTEKVNGIENVADMLERVSKLERMLTVLSEERTLRDSGIDKDEPLEERVESLQKILNSINHRLKDIEH